MLYSALWIVAIFSLFMQNCSAESPNFPVKTHPHTQSNTSLLNPFSVVLLKVHAYTLKIQANFPNFIDNNVYSRAVTPLKEVLL